MLIQQRTASFSLALIIRTDRIIASIPRASVMFCIVNCPVFIEIVRKRTIYALLKNSTFVNFTLFIKRYPSQVIKSVREGAGRSEYEMILDARFCNFKTL